MAFTFKSSGRTSTQVKTQSDAVSGSLQPIGIKTPVRFGDNSEGLLAMHYDLGDQIVDNFKNLLLTNKGERLGRYDMGTDLRASLCEFVNKEQFENEVIQKIADATSKWMPFINLLSLESKFDESRQDGITAVILKVIFEIPVSNNHQRSVEIVLRSY